MFHSELFVDPWVVAGLLAIGGLVVAVLAWVLGRIWGPVPLTGELEALAWSAVRQVRRAFVILAAGTLAIVGVLLLFLPGPGMLVLAAALALLATEFVWAKRWILALRERFRALGSEARGLFESTAATGAAPPVDHPASSSADRPSDPSIARRPGPTPD